MLHKGRKQEELTTITEKNVKKEMHRDRKKKTKREISLEWKKNHIEKQNMSLGKKYI